MMVATIFAAVQRRQKSVTRPAPNHVRISLYVKGISFCIFRDGSVANLAQIVDPHHTEFRVAIRLIFIQKLTGMIFSVIAELR